VVDMGDNREIANIVDRRRRHGGQITLDWRSGNPVTLWGPSGRDLPACPQITYGEWS
jgi:hypothetical protein